MHHEDEAAAQPLEATVARLRAEIAGLRRAMRNRAVIEQAKGVMAARRRVEPERAFDSLLRLSHDTNVKLAQVAATVVGTATPEPWSSAHPRPGEAAAWTQVVEFATTPPATTEAAAPRARPPSIEALHTAHQLIAARMAAASDHDELAEALAVATPGWPRPRAVLLATLEPDGAQRILGTHGVTPRQRSQWLRMPPQLEVPMTRAVRRRTPIIAADPVSVTREFAALADHPDPPAAAAALPLVHDARIIGSVGMSWSTALELRSEAERYLFALAEPVAAHMRRLSGGDDRPAISYEWLSIPLEAMHNPAVLLTPLLSGRWIVDFRIAHANVYAQALCRKAGVELAGATLLSLFPHAGSRTLLVACGEALGGGALRRLGPVRLHPVDLGGQDTDCLTARVTPVGGQVLLVWHPYSPAESDHQQMRSAEQVAQVGSFRWDPETTLVHLSPYLMHLLGSEHGRLADIDEVTAHLDEAGRPAARRLLHDAQAGTDQPTATVDVRGAGRLAGRFLRLTAEPATGPAGMTGVVGTVQDVTDQRRLQRRLRQADVALATQRRQAQVREQLAAAMLPEPRPLACRHVTADGVCQPAEGARTGWYDAAELPDGEVLLMAGHAVGSGIEAMAGAGRVRHALRSYALVRRSPAETLAAANDLVRFDRPGLTVGVVLARYRPARQRLCWAAAGPARPVHYGHDGAGMVLDGPHGALLGDEPDGRFHDSHLSVRPGDRILLHTAGLTGAAGDLMPAMLRTLAAAGRHAQPDDVAAMIQRITAPRGGAARELTAVLARFSRG